MIYQVLRFSCFNFELSISNSDQIGNNLLKIAKGITKQISRKLYKCNKCGNEIKPKDPYFRIKRYYEEPEMRCQECEAKPSDAMSWKVGQCYSVKEDLDKWFDQNKNKEEIDLESLKKIVIEGTKKLEDVIYEYQQSKDNVEEYFPVGEMVERLERYIEEIGNLEEQLQSIEEIAEDFAINIVLLPETRKNQPYSERRKITKRKFRKKSTRQNAMKEIENSIYEFDPENVYSF